MSLTASYWSILVLLQAAADAPARPEYSVLRPLLIGVIVLGLVIGVLRFLWRGRGSGGRPSA